MAEQITYPINGNGYILRQPHNKDGRIFKPGKPYMKDGCKIDRWEDGHGYWFEIHPPQNGVAESFKNTEEVIIKSYVDRINNVK